MIKKPKGTEDILPSEIYIWQYVEDTARNVFESYNFEEIRTPIFEDYELFQRGVGDETDMVSKEMYDFEDKGGRRIALRPEGTASICRAFVQHKLYGPEYPKPYKLYYTGPMFRYERPQAGRQRQFNQMGVEVLGTDKCAMDVEVMAMAWDLFEELGLTNIKLVINTIGHPKERRQFIDALIEYLTPHREELSEDSRRRLETNPLRILDSKDAKDQQLLVNAPKISDYLSQESLDNFQKVQSMLDALEIPYEVDPLLVRGIDYYQDTIFEMMVEDDSIGSQSTICGGGRYDGLVEELGGPSTPGFGFGIGLERLILLLKDQKVAVPENEAVDVFVICMGETIDAMAMEIIQAARQAGLKADRDYMGRSMKSQFKTVDRLKAKTVIVLGEDEVQSQSFTLKNTETQKQISVNLSDWLTQPDVFFRQITMDTSVIDNYFKGE
ncbi:histidine--tRNA ligase [Falseniella ignava]|uniref:Histidine--tRNA ligase n=1 Tax=Falseniella ignava CCUG 37419 TaxID=883112 RepID=K1MMB0_9LACT|nr:histidine--tRNA ligase [Falseniella ignava]EKB57244.1 histidine-tRNA ligase [Falseniella ignava CCUG 37419]